MKKGHRFIDQYPVSPEEDVENSKVLSRWHDLLASKKSNPENACHHFAVLRKIVRVRNCYVTLLLA